MSSFGFWQKWLLFVSVFLVVFGLALAVFPHSSLMDAAFNKNIDPVFWPGAGPPTDSKIFQAWIYGVLGSVIMGWGLVMAFVAHYPFRSREKWAWECVALCICTWYIADTGLSAYYHAYFNVLFNTVMLLLIGLPLILTRKHFKS